MPKRPATQRFTAFLHLRREPLPQSRPTLAYWDLNALTSRGFAPDDKQVVGLNSQPGCLTRKKRNGRWSLGREHRPHRKVRVLHLATRVLIIIRPSVPDACDDAARLSYIPDKAK
jgi:hypothetical protein